MGCFKLYFPGYHILVEFRVITDCVFKNHSLFLLCFNGIILTKVLTLFNSMKAAEGEEAAEEKFEANRSC